VDNLAVSGSAKDEMKVNKCAFSNNAINVKNDLATIVNHNPNPSISQHMTDVDGSRPVGYICLICFSKALTAGYINAIKSLEEVGAQCYIIIYNVYH
jgi:hypothetical protein